MLQREGERPQRDTQESGKKCIIEVSFMGVVGQEEGQWRQKEQEQQSHPEVRVTFLE